MLKQSYKWITSIKAHENIIFLQASFAGIEEDEDEDMEIQTMAANYKKKGGKIAGKYRITFL